MKKIIAIAFLILSNVTCVAQESVLLRYNYKKGDKFSMNMKLKQGMGAVGEMNMLMGMTMDIEDKKGDQYITSTKFTKISMDMLMSGNRITYDSDTKEEDLTPEAKEIKPQFDLLLKTKMQAKMSSIGETEVIKIDSEVPDMKKYAEQVTTMVYPKDAVKVGSEWTSELENQGVKVSVTYTIKSITKNKIIINITGSIPMIPNSKITGMMEVDKASGMPFKAVMNIDASIQGQNMANYTTITTKKVS